MYVIMSHSGGDGCFVCTVHSRCIRIFPSNLVSFWEFPPILVANPAVTRKGSQCVSGASRGQTYIDIVVKCYCVIRPANT